MSLIPFDDRDGVIWFDGKLIPWREAKIHVLSHGLHYGSSVFEGVRSYNGRVFKAREHTARLLASAQMLGFEVPYSADVIDQATRDVLEGNGITDGYIRPVAWRGSEVMGVAAKQSKIHLAIAAWVWPSYFTAEARMRGIRLNISKWARPSPQTAPTAAKCAGLYMICTLSKHAAEDEGYEDSLMYDYRGFIAEATGANVFLVIDGKIHTPEPDCFLDGITRKTTIELAKARGIEVIVRHIMPDELAKATEVFVTGTAAEITPVREIGPYSFTPAKITAQLIEDYTKLVNS
jgi:branched-chain amino acid aminotransferase